MLLASGSFIDDLTKTSSHTALTAAFILIVLSVIAAGINNTVGRVRLYIEAVVVIAVGALECYGVLTSRDNTGWMLSSLGNFFFAVGLIIAVVLMLVWQHGMLFGELDLLSDDGDFNHRYDWGFKSIFVAAIVALIAGIINEKYVNYVLCGLAVFQLWVIGYSIYSVIVRHGQVYDAILSIVVYIAGVAGFLCLFIHFIIPMIILFFFALSGKGRSGGRRSSSDSSEIMLEDGTRLYDGPGGSKIDGMGNTWERDNMYGGYYRRD